MSISTFSELLVRLDFLFDKLDPVRFLIELISLQLVGGSALRHFRSRFNEEPKRQS